MFTSVSFYFEIFPISFWSLSDCLKGLNDRTYFLISNFSLYSEVRTDHRLTLVLLPQVFSQCIFNTRDTSMTETSEYHFVDDHPDTNVNPVFRSSVLLLNLYFTSSLSFRPKYGSPTEKREVEVQLTLLVDSCCRWWTEDEDVESFKEKLGITRSSLGVSPSLWPYTSRLESVSRRLKINIQECVP